MQEVGRKRDFAIGLRAKLPLLTRLLALFVIVAGAIFVGHSYWKQRGRTIFVLVPKATELSTEITGRVDGYEQRITKEGRLYLWVRATRDLTFADGHHEMENVNIAIYPPTGDKPDQITANRAIYDPKNNVISFMGTVNIENKDGLKLNTESLTYDQANEIAKTDVLVNFSRENMKGHSTGATVEAKAKKLDLAKDVEVTVAPELQQDSTAKPKSARSRPVIIRAAHGTFDQASMKLTFSGGVTAEQERDVMNGDSLAATLNQQKKVEKVETRGNSYLRTMNPGHSAEVHAVDMDFFLDGDQRIKTTVARGDTRARSLDADSEMQITGANQLEANFQSVRDESLLQEVHTQGRSVVNLSAPKSRANDPRSQSKRLTADFIKLQWRPEGKDLQSAEAVGNAELYVEPVIKHAKADRKTLTASRFDGEFFDSGNLARVFTATGGSKVVVEPVDTGEKRGTRTVTAQKMVATFVRETQDVERVESQGDAKFNQLDRNGTAATITYTSADDTVRLRGGDPTVWDSRGRSKAIEMDSDLTHNVSYSRGKTATTYYSQEQTNGATPFTKVKSPVYVSSDRGEFRHDAGVAIYTGNARAWQDDNFVRSEKLTIYVNDKKMTASGRVQTALYNAKRKEKGTTSLVPVFAASELLIYSDPDRTLHYETNVDIRQAPDRIECGVADIYLQKDTNEVERTIAQKNVVMTQPNRKGIGDWMQYTTADEVAVLKGNPARVDDSEQGSTEGGRLTVYTRENKVIADDVRGPQSAGRVRSTHKIQKP